MPHRIILRAPEESRGHKLWVKFLELFKCFLPICCCCIGKAADVAVGGALNAVGAGAASPVAVGAIGAIEIGAEALVRRGLDNLENIGRAPPPTDHADITAAADHVEAFTDGLINVVRVVATVAADVALHHAGDDNLKPAVAVEINGAAAAVENVTDRAIALGEQAAVDIAEGAERLREKANAATDAMETAVVTAIADVVGVGGPYGSASSLSASSSKSGDSEADIAACKAEDVPSLQTIKEDPAETATAEPPSTLANIARAAVAAFDDINGHPGEDTDTSDNDSIVTVLELPARPLPPIATGPVIGRTAYGEEIRDLPDFEAGSSATGFLGWLFGGFEEDSGSF